MAIASPPAPFVNARYSLSPSVELTIMAPFEAGQAGVLCASMDPWARYRISAADLAAFFAQVEPNAPRFAIRVGGQFEGAVVIRTNWFAGPYIQMLALAPITQGQGVGSLVITFIEAQTRLARNRNLWVAASDFNEGALRFYQRHGFVRAAEIDGLLRNDRNEVLLRKKLFSAGPPPFGSSV